MSVCFSPAAAVCQREYKPDTVKSSIHLSVSPTVNPEVAFDSLSCLFNKSYFPRLRIHLKQHQPHYRQTFTRPYRCLAHGNSSFVKWSISWHLCCYKLCYDLLFLGDSFLLSFCIPYCAKSATIHLKVSLCRKICHKYENIENLRKRQIEKEKHSPEGTWNHTQKTVCSWLKQRQVNKSLFLLVIFFSVNNIERVLASKPLRRN